MLYAGGFIFYLLVGGITVLYVASSTPESAREGGEYVNDVQLRGTTNRMPEWCFYEVHEFPGVVFPNFRGMTSPRGEMHHRLSN